MSNPYASSINPLTTPQSEPLAGRKQVKNRAGGYVFALDPWEHLDRFLILGTEGGTYYATERALTRAAIEGVLALIAEDGARVVARVVEISESGRAPRNTPAIFALAAASVHGNAATKAAANAALARVCRTGTHLFQWAESIQALNGHGPSGAGQRRAVARWYVEKEAGQLAYQLAKYQQREGWSHRDLLRLSKPGAKQVPAAKDGAQRAALAWATGHGLAEDAPPILAAMESIKGGDEGAVIRAILDHGLTREMVPSEHLNSAAVWEALLAAMPIGAMVRNLGKMTEVGLIKPLSEAERTIVARLTDVERIRKARLHPVALLNAFKVYGQGRGVRGSLSWSPVQGVLTALEAAFDLAFQAVEPSGKRLYLAIDGSGSMAGAKCIGLDALTCVEGASAMALVTARREARWCVAGFDHQLKPLAITARSAMGEVVRQLGYGGATDASTPFAHATAGKIEVDAFVVYTDNETWAGYRHPCVALDRYRQATGIPAKLIVVAMAANEYSIGNRTDTGTVNVVGFDAAAPAVIADFVR